MYDGIDPQDLWSKMQAFRSLVQSLESAVAATKTVNVATYTDLLSADVTMVAGEALLIDFTACFANSAVLTPDQAFFEVLINSTSWRLLGTGVPLNSIPCNVGLTGRVAVGAAGLVVGANTLKVRWRRVGANTCTINPSTEGHHAVLRLARVQA